MTRWIPHPLLSAALLIMWLLINQSLSLGHILLGGAVALVASHAFAALRPEPMRVHRVRPIFGLVWAVLSDIVRSNLAVAAIVLFPKQRVSGFVWLPLELTNVQGLAVLAGIITATPGTAWVQLDRARSMVLVHVLDLVDKEDWVRLIKTRYETPLLEIFGR